MSHTSTLLPYIPGYILTDELYVGCCTAVYRALVESDTQPGDTQSGNKPSGDNQTGSVVIKVLKAPHPSVNELVRFRNQYIIAKKLTIPGIVKPLKLEPWHHSYALVMEDVGGLSLRDYMQTHGQLPVEKVIAIALQLADILQYLSQHRVLHKDINPANILIHPDTGQIWLIDFSLASLLPKESQALHSPHALEGTLAYIAPEQTGRMNRGIDYRTDFYGLGATLYELLTENRPFQCDDPMALIHSHIAKVPASPSEVSATPIPKVLSDIVLKLMAKNAEDRYQGALGLKHDLQQCLSQWVQKGTVVEFELGQRDVCDRFLIPEKLYGREAEVKTLMEAFGRVAQGASELMLMAGFSGIGKTAVINEVHKPITQQTGYFIKGKFEQFKRNIPFSAFVQAFRSLMEQLLSESDSDLADWKGKILAALGGQGQVLIEVVPELALIIGPQPEVPELSGINAQNRFNRLFGKFIEIFTTQDHPLVIFLDDLQWADLASLALLKLLMTRAEMGYLLVLGAYRDNEVADAHPLMLTLEELREASTSLHTIALGPLTEDDIHQLVAESLHCSAQSAAPLAQLVYHKTHGNPFFASQFLQGLQIDGWITFQPETEGWQCDLNQLRSLALTDDVVEFIIKRLQQWPQTTQNALAIAACLGNQFNLNTLALLCKQSPAALAQSLWPALQTGLLIPKSDTYKIFQNANDQPIRTELSTEATTHQHQTSLSATVSYRFLHDRVQQAAYALIPEQKKQHTHHHIGQLLLDHCPQEKQEDYIFDIVNQLNLGRALISRPEELEQLIVLNGRAGLKAKSETAYGAALNYFDIAIEILSEDGWQQNYPMALQLYENAAEAAYLTGNRAHMEALIKTVTRQAKNHLDTVKALQVKMQYCLSQNQPLVSIEIARGLLQALGLDLPETPTLEDVQQALATFKALASQFSCDDITALPTLTDPEKLAIVSTLMLVVPPTMIAKPNLFCLIVLAVNTLSLKYGNSPYSAYGYSTWAILLKNFEKDIDAAYEWGNLALRLRHTSQATVWGNRVCQSMSAFIIHGKRHTEETLSVLQEGYTSGLENGDFEFSAYAIFVKCYNLYFLGRELSDVSQTISKTIESLANLRQNLPASWLQCCHQTIHQLSGANDDDLLAAGGFDAETLDVESFVKAKQKQGDAFGLCYFHFNQATLLYLLGDYPQALTASKLAEHYIAGPKGMLIEVVFYFFDSLIRLACAQGPDDEKTLAKVNENQQKMKLWAEHAPMNFQHKYDLVCAEQQRLWGDRTAAMDYYDLAIAEAKANGYVQEQALANELAAKFYVDWGKEKIAAVYVQEAYLCYEQWGAKAKTDDLVTQHPLLLQPILQQTNAVDPLTTLHDIAPLNLSGYSSLTHAQPTANTLNTTLDLATVFKSAQALSESINLTELLEKLTPMMLQTSGAERLALLLPNADNTWKIRVTATAETTELVSASLTDHPHLPVQLIRYALRTQEILEVDGLTSRPPILDPYLQQYPQHSALCLPLLHQSKFIGLLYLDHHSVAGLFNRDRIALLNVLCTQAAISLENALLNQALEQKLEVQTAQYQASETRFQSMVNNLPGVVFQATFTLDGTDTFSYVSPNCHALYEVTAEAVMGGHHSLRDFEHREDVPFIERYMEEISQTLQPFNFDFRIVTPSGTLKWVQVNGHPSKQPDDSILWDGFILDVSERKKLEQEQARLNELLALKSSAIEAADIGIAILSDNKYIYLNESHLSLMGYESHELLGESWEKLYEPEESERLKQQIFPIVAQQSCWLGEAPARRKDGSHFPQEVSLCLLEDNKMICICRDISERKHYEQQLQTLSNTLEIAIESAQIGIWDWDGESNRLSWDKRMLEIYGVSPEAFQGRYQDWANLVHPEDLARYEAGTRQNHERYYTQEFRVIRPDNTIRYILSTASIERDEQGQNIRIVGTNLDITERKTAELALQESQAFLKTVLDTFPLSVFWKDRACRYMGANQNFVQDAGFDKAEDIAGLTDFDMPWSETEARSFQAEDQAVMLSDTPKLGILQTQINADGTQKWLETNKLPLHDLDGNVIGVLSIYQDISDRKQLEQEQNRLTQILQSTSDFVGICRPGKGILWQNQPFRELRPDLKITEEDVPISKLYPTWAFEIVKQMGVPAAIEQGVWSGETALLTPTGEEIPTSQVIIAHKSEQGEIEYFSTILRDISDRKRTEAALQLSEARATAIFNQATVGIVEASLLSGKLIRFNDYFCNLLGYSRNELKDMNLQDVTHPDDLLECKKLMISLDTGKIRNFALERRFIHKNGTTVWVLASANKVNIPNGKPHSGVAILQDISDRKATELALQDAQTQFRRMTENVPGMIYRSVIRADDTRGFLYISSKVQEFFELEPEAVLQNEMLIWDRIHPHDVPRLKNDIAASVEVLQAFKSEFRLLLPQKGLRWVEINSQPEQLENGDIIWDGVLIDMSDHKQAEAQLQRTNEELVRATRMKDEFLANMSHELRTPLNAILGMAEGLQDEVFGKINQAQLNALTTIENSGSHLLELINEVLDLAKIEAGNIELAYSSVSVTHLCQSSLTFVKQQSQKNSVQLYLNTPWDLPHIRVDERRFRQVLINLLNNAVKFTPAGGKVTLNVALVPVDKTHSQPYLRFEVSDTGIGISPNELNRLFQPFVQIDSALNRQYEGTGLGLALVKRIVELHGGCVTVTSAVGVGSCFTIELPYDIETQKEAASPTALLEASSPPAEREPSTKAPLILLAEDNEANIVTLSSYLQAQGYRIQLAPNGQAAIDLAQSEKPHAILMDIQLPKVDGLTAIRRIRTLPGLDQTPIIALTAFAMEGDQARCLAAGADKYLSKPVKLKQLTASIQELIPE